MTTILKNNRWLLGLLVIFIFTRFLGLDQLYHQDEYRWVSIVNTAEFGKVDSPHPPIMENLFSLGGKLLGYDNLRAVPFIFGILNLLLIYAISLNITKNRKIAYFSSGLYVVSVYGLIANLMIDIDGAVMPFFVLLTYYLYLRSVKDGNRIFLLPMVVVAIAGFLTKLSFTLFVGALAVEYLWVLYEEGKLKANFKKLFYLFSGVTVSIIAMYVYYGSSHPWFIEYTIRRFNTFNFGSRAYFELFLRLLKFFIWLSPLLFLPMVYGLFRKDFFIKYRLWYIYSLFNFLFYLVIFDFARLPIERYFMFIIAPAVIISGHVIYSLLPGFGLNKKRFFLSILGFMILLAFTLLITYDVVPLNPKEAYIDKVQGLDFNFLIPVTGGSGPIGFYVSAQFVLWVWIVGFLWLLFNKKKYVICFFVVFGVGYNFLLLSENLTGALYGGVNDITKTSVEYVIDEQEIDGVITYYDAGVYYLQIADKYDGRFYTAPNRDYTPRMTAYRGHYMVVDFPAIDKNSLYWKLISRCELDKKFTDKYVDSYIFDCRSLPPN